MSKNELQINNEPDYLRLIEQVGKRSSEGEAGLHQR